MSNEHLQIQTFLFASNTENPDRFFQGYCFIDNDYVFGSQGAEKYNDETRKNIKGGQDGCYVVAERRGNNYIFYSDYSGYKKIFYYWTPDCWVVSNSIFLIAEHLKNSGIRLCVNYPQLAALGVIREGFFSQLYSTATMIDGVRILPVNCSLEIGNLSYFVSPQESIIQPTSYEEGLLLFAETWISRISGLLANKIDVEADLTGGADSRTVFALLNTAANLLVQDCRLPMLRSISSADSDLDQRIAGQIAKAYGFPINGETRSTIHRFSGEESYFSWKSLCLGVYHPVYFSNRGPQANMVKFGGAGGEKHRPFYHSLDVDTFIKRKSEKLSPNWLALNFCAELGTEFERLTNKGGSIDPLIMHYREHRNRMHSGRTPQYVVSFTPLGSLILDATSQVAGHSRIATAQINYDLMASLLPDVFNIPFDDERKNLNKIRRDNLTRISKLDNLKIGKVFIPTETIDKRSQMSDCRTKTPIQLLFEDFETSAKKSFVRAFFGSEFMMKAEATMSAAAGNKSLPRAADGQYAAAVIAAGLFE